MASTRLGSPFEEMSNTPKKPKLDIQPIKAFYSVADITPQTATLPKQETSTLTPAAAATSATQPATNQPGKALPEVWVVLEQWHPKTPSPEEKSMVRILGIFTNTEAALEHAEEHTRALYTVTTDGICSEAEEEDDRASEDMSPTSVFERRLEYFRGLYERTEEEDLEDGEKKWTVYWDHVTEVWVEKREVYEEKDHAGYFTPLPVDDDVEGREWPDPRKGILRS